MKFTLDMELFFFALFLSDPAGGGSDEVGSSVGGGRDVGMDGIGSSG